MRYTQEPMASANRAVFQPLPQQPLLLSRQMEMLDNLAQRIERIGMWGSNRLLRFFCVHTLIVPVFVGYDRRWEMTDR